MTFTSFDYVRLKYAKLCIDCEIIFEKSICPMCGGHNWIDVNKILNKKEFREGQ